MKTIKFRKNLSKIVLSGEKTTTWRLFDDKDLHEGDLVNFMVGETGEVFARANLIKVDEKTFEELDETDWRGHEKFSTEREMYQIYSKYYNQKVDGRTLVKVIHFVLL